MKQFDYIIIGAGSAGCVLANRLSKKSSTSVALIEAGGSDNNPVIHMPLGYGKSLHDPKLSWNLWTAEEPEMGGRKLPLPRGKVLGGSSSLNGMIYVRGHPEDYNTWANLGCTGWGWQDILPYFKKSESFDDGGDELHGSDGPLSVTNIIDSNTTDAAMIKAFIEYGIPQNDDFNGPNQEGTGLYHVTMKAGKRCSTAAGYLKPVKKRKNLTVFTNAKVQKINFQGNRAISVEVNRKNSVHTLHADQEILVCAGAYHSPHLLQLSGIGAPDHLKSLNIDVIANNPETGENLQDHYMAPMMWSINPGFFSYNKQLDGFNLVKNTLKYYLRKTGPMTIPAANVGAFIKSEPSLTRPDLQFHGLAVTGDLEHASEGGNIKLTDYEGLTLGGAMLRPESRGYVRAASSDPLKHPKIIHNYLKADEDKRLTIKAMEIARDVAAMPSLADIVKTETLPGPDVKSYDEMLGYQLSLGTTMYHPVGTCRMGRDDKAVVDTDLRVNGAQGLRVIDASIMPRLISGNTNATTIAIAEKGADLILGR